MVNCRKFGTEQCPNSYPRTCPCVEAGESLVDLVFLHGLCDAKEPYEAAELMKVREDYLKAEEGNPAIRADRLRRVRRIAAMRGM